MTRTLPRRSIALPLFSDNLADNPSERLQKLSRQLGLHLCERARGGAAVLAEISEPGGPQASPVDDR